jgi:hypothetical protein
MEVCKCDLEKSSSQGRGFVWRSKVHGHWVAQGGVVNKGGSGTGMLWVCSACAPLVFGGVRMVEYVRRSASDNRIAFLG